MRILELLITIPEKEWDEESPLYASQSYIKQLTSDLQGFTDKVEIKAENVGMGADWPVLLLLFGNLIVMGKEINDAIDAWLGLANKFSSLLSILKTKYGTTLISRDAAKLVCLDYLSQGENITHIEELDGNSISLSDTKCLEDAGFSSDPLSLYILCFRVNHESLYVIGVKSTGNINFCHVFNTASPYSFFEN